MSDQVEMQGSASGVAPQAAEEPPARNTRPLVLLALHVLLLIYSFSGVLSKNASMQEFMSVPFILLYGGTIVILGVYALGWQQIIKRLPLTLAFTNKAVTVVWGIVWGALLFGEQITVPMIIGGALVIAGVALFGYADAKEQSDGQEPEAAVEPRAAGSAPMPSADDQPTGHDA